MQECPTPTDPHAPSANDLAAALGGRIRAARQARRLSQTELALAVGQPQTSISAYERGARLPDAHQLECLARALGTRVGLLMGEVIGPRDFDPLDVPGYHVALGGVDLSVLPPESQAEIMTVVRFLVLLARERAHLPLDDPALRTLPQIRNLLAGQPRNPHDRRFRHRRRTA